MLADPILLYLHLPKCGGTTLSGIIYHQVAAKVHYEAEKDPFNPENYLFHAGIYYFGGKDASAGFFKDLELTIPNLVKRALGREDMRAVVGHFWFGIHTYLARPWTYVTVLRRPLVRVVSLYSHMT